MTLIDHTEEWLSMMNAMNATEDGEISEEAETLMEKIESDLASKVDGCVRFMEELRLSRTVCLDMADKYQKKADAWNRKMEWMKQRVLSCLHRMGLKELKTPLHRIYVAANGGSQGVDILGDFIPQDYLKTKTTTVPDTDKIRKELESGKELSFARLKERGTHLRIA